MRPLDQVILIGATGVLVLFVFQQDMGDETPEPAFRPFALPTVEPEWMPPEDEPPAAVTEFAPEVLNRLRFHKRRLSERKVAP